MNDALWKKLTKNLDEKEDMSDEEFENELANLWGWNTPNRFARLYMSSRIDSKRAI